MLPSMFFENNGCNHIINQLPVHLEHNKHNTALAGLFHTIVSLGITARRVRLTSPQSILVDEMVALQSTR